MSDKRKTKVALVIPAYNEAKVIAEVVRGLDKTFSKSKFDYQIVVVDDGSKDNTAEEAKAAGAYVIRHVINMGSGGATATGLSYAQQNNFDIASTSDADGQHDPKDVLRGVQVLQEQNVDLLIGSRLLDIAGMSSLKRFGNKGLSLITFMLFGVNVTDSQSGLRIFSRQALEQLKWRTSGYEFCSEMLWRAKQLKLSISEFPIKAIYTDYSKVKGQNNWNAINILKRLIHRRIVEMFE